MSDPILKAFRFPVPPELAQTTRQTQKAINKFIRESVACLQAQAGIKSGGETMLRTAQKICVKVPILKDPKPTGFPYWVKYMY